MPSAFGLPTCHLPDAQATPLLLAPRFSLYSIRKRETAEVALRVGCGEAWEGPGQSEQSRVCPFSDIGI